MKYLLSLFILLAVVACDWTDSSTPIETNSADSTLIKLRPNYDTFKYYEIIVIDGCEYIAYKDNARSISIEHKGNCKNPIHYQVKHDTLYVLQGTSVVLQKQRKF